MLAVSTSTVNQESADSLRGDESTTQASVKLNASFAPETANSVPNREEAYSPTTEMKSAAHSESTSLGPNNETTSWAHSFWDSTSAPERTDSESTSGSTFYQHITVNWQTVGLKNLVEDFNLQVRYV